MGLFLPTLRATATDAPPSRPRAPADLPRRVLLINTLRPSELVQALDAPLGILAVNAGIRQWCTDVESRVLDWNTFVADGRAQAFAELLREYRPAIVGISAFSFTIPLATRIAEIVRAWDPRVPIVLGGYHATADPEGVSRHPEFDYYVISDGVQSGPLLFQRLLDGEPPRDDEGPVTYRGPNGVVSTGQVSRPKLLDGDPPIDWRDLDLDLYRQNAWTRTGGFIFRPKRGELLPFRASTGCPFRCEFCERADGKVVRGMSPAHAVDELRALRDTFGSEHVFLFDNIIHLRRPWFDELLVEMSKGLDMTFMAMVMADKLDEPTIDAMMAAGIRYLTVFPEAGSERIRRAMKKPIVLERLIERAAYASRQGAFITAAFLLGWPTETREEAESTIRLAENPLWDSVLMNPLIYFGAAGVGRDNLAANGMAFDTAEYFHHLDHPEELCLAAYTKDEYLGFWQRGVALNHARLERPETRAKMDRLGMQVDYVGHLNDGFGKQAPERDDPRRSFLASLLARATPLDVTAGPTTLRGLSFRRGGAEEDRLVLRVADESGELGEVVVGALDEPGGRPLTWRAGPLGLATRRARDAATRGRIEAALDAIATRPPPQPRSSAGGPAPGPIRRPRVGY